MQTLAFDGHTGASGDMILAALVAAGGDPGVLTPVENALGVEYRIGETIKNGISATTVDVLFEGSDGNRTGDSNDEPSDDSDEKDHHHTHAREHGSDGHTHEHGENGHNHTHTHEDNGSNHTHEHDTHTHTHGEDTHAERSGPNRTYGECRDIVAGMDLPEGVKSDAKAIFRLLGEAEARVHGTELEETHFHEVGADDAIADIVGAALLLFDLDVDRVVTTPIAGGGGEVSMSHGVYPVPTPAVAYIAAEAAWSLVGGPLETELLTPTGAAILAHFADGVESFPPLAVDTVGYGAGDKSFDDRPNVLRATVGTASGTLRKDGIRVLETNVDDVTPEVLGSLQERLTAAGARDVTILPATMKKSRPGHLIKVIVKPEDVQAVTRRLASETGTLGIRETAASHRWIADRSFETVELTVDGDSHEMTVKIAADGDDEIYDVSGEYDDAMAIAERTDLPVREVLRRAETSYRDQKRTETEE
jgi:uncharacterized protein (TIGR00299 family) protein